MKVKTKLTLINHDWEGKIVERVVSEIIIIEMGSGTLSYVQLF